ncbi:predicted protein [Nematostella vectensis]|uniref:RING-type domain-containing protein n=1 Tax=Nematostella vectensis TaxID=45351 RepID=A7S9R7_NEMVE|nr:predicted protein [Nematostella vectensis]|eukprot:XP_001631591.1 predicted protein [Nematostella vectensis]
MAQTYPNKTTSLERHALKISKKTNTKGYERKARPSQATPPIIKSKTLRVSKQSSLKKLQRALNDELRCSVCYEVFSDPRTLTACLHSFCKECLHKMLSKRSKYIHCPLCRKKTAVPRRGVKGLPLNSVIRRLVDVHSSEGMTSARHRKRHPGIK